MDKSDDEAFFRMMAGAYFAPGSTVTLPSGREISGSEATALSGMYAPDAKRERSVRQPAKRPWWRFW